MRMPLTLHSDHPSLEIRRRAQHTYRCKGRPKALNDGGPDRSPCCNGRIESGTQYIAEVEWQDRGYKPNVKKDINRFCVHCALRYFVAIKIAGSNAAIGRIE